MKNNPFSSIVLIIVICFITLQKCAILEKYLGPNSSGSYYVIADRLNVREAPSSTSKKVGTLPYGTYLSFERTDQIEEINGKKSFWFFSKQAKGYVFGSFLNPKAPSAGVKEMKLTLRSSDFCYFFESQTVRLFSEKIILRIERTEEGGSCVEGEFTGNYKIEEGQIIGYDFHPTGGRDDCEKQGVDPKLPPIEYEYLRSLAISNSQMILKYDSFAEGFLTPGLEKAVRRSPKSIIREICVLRSKHYCNYGSDTFFEQGYYCESK
ncbi:SH3 domain-containing protein [Leptospira neocaledonica]|nr:SH3 domain-containing protein [Leptospira neocaledonica]